jgi:hypothetical protein
MGRRKWKYPYRSDQRPERSWSNLSDEESISRITRAASFTVVRRPDGCWWWWRIGRIRDDEQRFFLGLLKATNRSLRNNRHSRLTNAMLVIASPSSQNQTYAHLGAKQPIACCIARGTASSPDAHTRLILFRRALKVDSRIRTQAKTANLCKHTHQSRSSVDDQTCARRFMSTPYSIGMAFTIAIAGNQTVARQTSDAAERTCHSLTIVRQKVSVVR